MVTETSHSPSLFLCSGCLHHLFPFIRRFCCLKPLFFPCQSHMCQNPGFFQCRIQSSKNLKFCKNVTVTMCDDIHQSSSWPQIDWVCNSSCNCRISFCASSVQSLNWSDTRRGFNGWSDLSGHSSFPSCLVDMFLDVLKSFSAFHLRLQCRWCIVYILFLSRHLSDCL